MLRTEVSISPESRVTVMAHTDRQTHNSHTLRLRELIGPEGRFSENLLTKSTTGLGIVPIFDK